MEQVGGSCPMVHRPLNSRTALAVHDVADGFPDFGVVHCECLARNEWHGSGARRRVVATAALDDPDTGRARARGARRSPAARSDDTCSDADTRSVANTCGSTIPISGSFTPRERAGIQGQPARN